MEEQKNTANGLMFNKKFYVKVKAQALLIRYRIDFRRFSKFLNDIKVSSWAEKF